MSKRNRKTLKNFFQKGRLPTEGNFSDLIDSTVNIIDEGINKTFEDGLKIATIGDSKKLISLYRNIQDENPGWFVELGSKDDSLLLFNSEKKLVMKFNQDGSIAVNKDRAEYALDVEGIVASQGRIGNYASGRVPADGKWHVVLNGLEGCQAFEIMAGAGKKGSGKYALAQATAISTYNSKNKIKYTQAYYGSMCNKLRFKWGGDRYSANLLVKSRCNYGNEIFISYYITRLWFDKFMEKSQNSVSIMNGNNPG